MKNIEEVLQKFVEDFTRKNLMTGKLMDNWFIKDATTSNQLKQFIKESYLSLLENLGKEIEEEKKWIKKPLARNIKEEITDFYAGFNQALSDIQQIIKKKI